MINMDNHSEIIDACETLEDMLFDLRDDPDDDHAYDAVLYHLNLISHLIDEIRGSEDA